MTSAITGSSQLIFQWQNAESAVSYESLCYDMHRETQQNYPSSQLKENKLDYSDEGENFPKVPDVDQTITNINEIKVQDLIRYESTKLKKDGRFIERRVTLRALGENVEAYRF